MGSGLERAVAGLGLAVRPSWALASIAAIAASRAWEEAIRVALPEELLFRGLLQGELARRLARPWLAVGIAALIFALAHLAQDGRVQSLATFFPGLLFGGLRLRSQSIWPAVAAHAVANVLWLSVTV